MAKSRLDKTLADYVVIAISPVLIMTLVGSLVFFLLEVSYRGRFESRMHWIMFWFVFGAVLVARIAIEEGREHARLFGIALCAVVAVGAARFVEDAVLIAWILLAVVWWCSSKLTWDCTLIDESEDASGEGLLQAAGFNAAEETDAGTARRDKKSKASATIDESEQLDDSSDDSISADSAGGKRRPHAPGLWVVYFSLAALPLFGVGQLFIPAAEAGRRSYAFQLLAVYVASALALLLTTSFLGLRRYLRQRRLEMSASMTRGWLGMGTVLLVALLLLALLIPRPQGEYTLTAMIDKIDAKVKDASKWAVLKNDRGDGQGRKIGDADPKAKPGEGQPQGKGQPDGRDQGNAQQERPNNNDGKGDGKSGGKQDGKSGDQAAQKADQNNNAGDKAKQQQQADAKQRADQAQQGQKPQQAAANKLAPATPAASTTSGLMASLAPFVKWGLYGLLALVGIYLLIRHWSKLVEILAKLWAELLALFGRRPKPTCDSTGNAERPVERDIRPFASYVNPYSNGTAARMSPPQLVRYTFEALEAWSREQVIERPPEQTPLEFADELGRRVPTLAKDVTQTAQLYIHIAYSRKTPSRDRLDVLERMWRQLSS